MNREQELHGPFFITSQSNLAEPGIVCAQCGKLLSWFDKRADTHEPAVKQLIADGAVPVPNFGWFCSQTCGDAYSAESGIGFERNAKGKISYYPEFEIG